MFSIFTPIRWIRKNITIRDSLIILAIVILYFVTRLINLDALPVFGDEGIYVHWAKVAWKDASWRFVSLTDGKQPLQTWGTIPFLKLYPEAPLYAGRMFSVFTGFFSLSGMFTTCYYLFGKRSAFIGSLLYVVTPMFLFYDRMALVDSAVNGFAIWMFLFSILLVKTMRLDIALIYGLLSGMALLAKSSVRLFLGLGVMAFALVISVSGNVKNTRDMLKKFINFSILYLFASVVALVMYNIQRLSPFFHYVAEKNKTFIMTPAEFLADPLANVFNNVKIIPSYVFSEMGYVIGLIGLIGLFYLYKKDQRLFVYFAAWIVIPFLIIAFVSKVIFPRYLIFFAGTLTILASYLLTRINKTQLLITSLLITFSVAYFNYAILFDVTKIPFPEVDRGQYIEGITAGWGIEDIVEQSRVKSRQKNVILIAEGNFGVIGDQLDAYVAHGETIFIKGYWPLTIENVIENQEFLDDHYVFVVFSHQKELPKDWPIELIKEYKKPGNQASIFFAEVVSFQPEQ